jgi:hypothetical protein
MVVVRRRSHSSLSNVLKQAFAFTQFLVGRVGSKNLLLVVFNAWSSIHVLPRNKVSRHIHNTSRSLWRLAETGKSITFELI